MYLDKIGRSLELRLKEHSKGEDDRTTNSLYARHFIETGHKFINPSENFKILKLVNNINKEKFFVFRNIKNEKGK